jgi:hypothetical protein
MDSPAVMTVPRASMVTTVTMVTGATVCDRRKIDIGMMMKITILMKMRIAAIVMMQIGTSVMMKTITTVMMRISIDVKRRNDTAMILLAAAMTLVDIDVGMVVHLLHMLT